MKLLTGRQVVPRLIKAPLVAIVIQAMESEKDWQILMDFVVAHLILLTICLAMLLLISRLITLDMLICLLILGQILQFSGEDIMLMGLTAGYSSLDDGDSQILATWALGVCTA